MPQITIHLTDQEYQKIQETMNHNGKTDLGNESFSGTEIRIEMTPFGNFLKIKGYKECEIDLVGVEFQE